MRGKPGCMGEERRFEGCSSALSEKGRICRFNLPFSKDVLLQLMLLPSSGRFSFDVDSDPRRDTTLILFVTRRA